MSNPTPPASHLPPAPSEKIYTNSNRVTCDGGGALGHPRVWLEMGAKNEVECPYCDARLVHRDFEGRV